MPNSERKDSGSVQQIKGASVPTLVFFEHPNGTRTPAIVVQTGIELRGIENPSSDQISAVENGSLRSAVVSIESGGRTLRVDLNE